MGLSRQLQPSNGGSTPMPASGSAPPSAPTAAAKAGAFRARVRIRMILGVLLGLNIVLLLLVLRPPGRSLAQRQLEVKQNRARYDETLATVRQMRDLKSKLEAAIQNDREFSQGHFLDRRAAFSTMLADLEKLATDSKLKTASIEYQLKEDTKQPGFVNLAVTVTVEGGYPDLVRFINKVEQSRLFWIIDTLNVSSATGRGLRLNLLMETFTVSS
jgi:Tfp pilus assembly protein PilO